MHPGCMPLSGDKSPKNRIFPKSLICRTLRRNSPLETFQNICANGTNGINQCGNREHVPVDRIKSLSFRQGNLSRQVPLDKEIFYSFLHPPDDLASGVIMQDIPVLAERTTGTRFSTARKTLIAGTAWGRPFPRTTPRSLC